MTTRAADATIKGYYYQFDTSILKLLELSMDSDAIVVEGIEDIDINTATSNTTVQCKYLSKPKFINSVVREPITLMLDHFINTQTANDYNYILYAHFESETPGIEPIIDLIKLKEILTYSVDKIQKHYEIEKNISDAKLNSFLKQFKFVFGAEFNIQQKVVIEKLKAMFNCSDFEADTLYYNNSLRIIIDTSIKKSHVERRITKADFLSKIDCSKKLFNAWFIRLRSKKEYLKLVGQNIKVTKVLEPSRGKVILIGKDILNTSDSELPLLTFIENLIAKYYKLNSALRDAKPLSIILDCNKLQRIEIKTNLIDKGIEFNDGWEEIKFSPEVFNKEPVINKTPNGTKILKSSYILKLISNETFEINFLNINSPSAFLVFSNEDFSRRFPNGQFFDIKYCDNLKDIHKLLIP